jgi:hypothetical protein
MNVSLVQTPATRQFGQAQPFTQQQSAAPFPQESIQLSNGGGMNVSTKNAIVSAAAGLAIGGLSLTVGHMVPGGHIGTWLAGTAIFALAKGVHHGFEEVKANKANGSPYSDDSCFKLGFKTYGARNVLNGLLHSTINIGLASWGGMGGALAGAAASGTLTKLTGY